MNRRFRIVVFFTAVFGAAAAFAAVKIPFGKSLPRTQQAGEVPEEAVARSVYVLNETNWTTFRVPTGASRLTILSRAHFRSGLDLLDRFFPYSISYRLERLDGTLVTEGVFDQRTDFAPMVDEEGNPRPAAFFSGKDTKVSASKASILEIEKRDLLALRVRLKSYDPAISEISMRVFQTREMDQNRPGHLWNRLSRISLERIGERRVHNLATIQPSEQLSILRNRPVPLGASGINGQDFNQLTLYIRNDLKPKLRKIIEPLGVGQIRCGPARRAMIGIPSPGGAVKLVVKCANPSGDRQLLVRYYGETIRERETFTAPLDSERIEFVHSFKTGLLEVESPVPVTVRPYLSVAGATEKALELEPAKVRAWRVEAGYPVIFSRNVRAGTGFLKVNARPTGARPLTLKYTQFDQDGRVLLTGSRRIEAMPSLYDFELTHRDELPVNDPQHIVIRLSEKVASVRFDSEAPCLINGYLRPSNLVHQTRVPADYDRALPDPDRLPVWFWVRPEGADTMVKSHRSHLLQTQPRPPVDDEQILAGKYQWEDFQPLNGVSQYLFRQVEAGAEFRIEALPSLFSSIENGRDSAIYPETLPGLLRPTRRLAFIRPDSSPRDLSLSIDGQPFFNRRLVTARGEIVLPPLPESFSMARIEYSGEDLHCAINYIKPASATHLKRRAQKIAPGKSFEYLCRKATAEEELLTGMLFAVAGSVDESEVSLSIEPAEGGGFLSDSDSFTIRERSWIIAPNPESTTAVLGGNIPAVDAGRRFFIPFGRDMKPGLYRVSISCSKGPGGYLTLSKVLGGDYSDARFFRDISR